MVDQNTNLQKQPQACNFIKKEILAQAFSCEFCEISKNAFSYRKPPMAASESNLNIVITYWSKLETYENDVNPLQSGVAYL